MSNTVEIAIYKFQGAPATHHLTDVPWFAGVTVLQAMIIGEAMHHESKFEFQVAYRSVYGAYVNSIDGLPDGFSPGHYWMLYVDGAASDKGVSESLVFEDDTVTNVLIEWKYEEPTAADHPQVAGRTKGLTSPAAQN